MSKNNLPQLLQDLAAEVDQGFIEDTFEINGHRYLMRLLSDGETSWKNRYIDAFASALAMISQRKAPTLAVGIRAINGIKVTDIFKPTANEDSSEEAKKEVKDWEQMGELKRQFAAAEKLVDYLSKRPAEFTTGLYDKWQELEKRRDEVMTNLKKS